jgi:hypothetical protein
VTEAAPALAEDRRGLRRTLRWLRAAPETRLLLLLALAVRVVAWVLRPAILPDSADLLGAAERVRELGPPALLGANHHPLPVVLFALLGRLGDPETLGAAAAALLGAAAVVPLHALARRSCGRHAATSACVLYAVLPKFVSVTSVPLAEAVFLPLFLGGLAAAMAAGVARSPRERRIRLVVAGLASAAAYLCRPEGLVGGAAAALGAALQGRRGTRIASFLLVAAVFCAASAPWVVTLSVEREALTLSPKKDLARFAGAAPAPAEAPPGERPSPAAAIRRTSEALWDAVGPALPFVALGAFPRSRWRRRQHFRARWTLLLTAAVLCALVVRLHAGWGYAGGRHLLGAGALLLPFAGEGAVTAFAFFSRTRHRRLGALLLTTFLAIPLGVRAVLRPDGEGGLRERRLGEALAAAEEGRAGGDVLVASFREPLVAYYADRALREDGRRCRNVRLLREHGNLLSVSCDLEGARAALAAHLRSSGATWLVLDVYDEVPDVGGARPAGRDLADRLVGDGVIAREVLACGSELAAFPVLPPR